MTDAIITPETIQAVAAKARAVVDTTQSIIDILTEVRDRADKTASSMTMDYDTIAQMSLRTVKSSSYITIVTNLYTRIEGNMTEINELHAKGWGINSQAKF